MFSGAKIADFTILPLAETVVGAAGGSVADKVRSVMVNSIGLGHSSQSDSLSTNLGCVIAGGISNALVLYFLNETFFKKIDVPPTGFFIFIAAYLSAQRHFAEDVATLSANLRAHMDKVV